MTPPVPPHFLLPATYRANGWNYKLVTRNDRAAIFSQSLHPDLPPNGKAAAYEVFVIQRRPDRVMPNGDNVEASEGIPSPSEWGRLAWSPPTLERAKVIFDEITAGIRPVQRQKGLPATG